MQEAQCVAKKKKAVSPHKKIYMLSIYFLEMILYETSITESRPWVKYRWICPAGPIVRSLWVTCKCTKSNKKSIIMSTRFEMTKCELTNSCIQIFLTFRFAFLVPTGWWIDLLKRAYHVSLKHESYVRLWPSVTDSVSLQCTGLRCTVCVNLKCDARARSHEGDSSRSACG